MICKEPGVCRAVVVRGRCGRFGSQWGLENGASFVICAKHSSLLLPAGHTLILGCLI